jgi:hypothetical protein
VEGVVIAMLVAFPLFGFASRSWLALILPLVAWPLFYVGLTQHWWGDGTGDAWQFVAVTLTLVGVGSTALAVSVAQALWPRPGASLADS